ncbi:Mannan endo-1,6-alpha-mannosidase DFG5 [Paramyrothecium foliicola]|nr:Mannan endo-1,6-alpha-mannosidase DFG5 [Paramyrothecium foliicola]
MKSIFQAATVGLALFGNGARCISLEVGNEESTKEAAATVAYGLMKFYTGNNTGDNPGNLPSPYYWWLAGAMFGTMVDYWKITGDDSYVEPTKQALMHQMGETFDYMPENHTRTMGNDDQGFWLMSAMSAAEVVFPDPPEDHQQWLAAVQAGFNEYTVRWEESDEFCGGGLRWQVFSFNTGYNYKNTISNGCFFNIAARLARYTGNSTYAEWAGRIFQWQLDTELILPDGSVRDGITIRGNDCSDMDVIEWSYNAGIYLGGVAVMYNITEGDDEQNAMWKERLDAIFDHSSKLFLENDVIHEQFCELHDTCKTDQRSFKGYYLRWLTMTAQMAPYLREKIKPMIETAASAAAASCTGDTLGEIPPFKGHPGTACGFTWLPLGTNDNWRGPSEQMNSLSAIMYTMEEGVNMVASKDTGGTSKGDVNGGVSDSDRLKTFRDITTGDKVGAGFLTALICAGVLGGTSFLIL